MVFNPWEAAKTLLVALLISSTQRCSSVPSSQPAPAPVPGERQRLPCAAHLCAGAPAPNLHVGHPMCHGPAPPWLCWAESKRSSSDLHPLPVFCSDPIGTSHPQTELAT